MIVDNSFLIDLMRNDNDPIRKAEIVEAEGDQICITTVSVFELYFWFGFRKKRVLEQ